MAITYDELVTLITDTLQSDDEDTFAAHVDDFIDMAEDMIIKNVQLPVMTRKETDTLASSDEHVVTPDDYIASLSFVVISGGTRYQLKFKDASFLDAAFPSTSATGRPKYYAQGNEGETGRLRLRPVPDSAYSYEHEYSCRPGSLVDAGGSNTTWISTNMKTALVYGALMHAALYILENDTADKYRQLFMDATGLTKLEQEGKARTDRRRREYRRPDVQES